jgi:hypothetical protein
MTLSAFLVLALAFEVAHAWEEYHFTFKNGGSADRLTGINFSGKLKKLSQGQSNLLVYKVMMFVMIALIALITAGGGWRVAALTVLGTYFTYQLHHVLEGIIYRKYNPGLVTALLWTPVVIIWWLSFSKFV